MSFKLAGLRLNNFIPSGLITMSTHNITSWNLESIRLSVFLKESPSFEPDWWRQVIGKEPEVSTNKRQLGQYIDEGTSDHWRIALNISSLNQNRVDWIVYPSEEALIGFSHIGQYTEQSELFFNKLEKWLADICPSAVRIALGAVLIHECSDRKASYQLLELLLPIIAFEPDNWSDFSFQVNKKATSTVISNLEINQITKWDAIRMRQIRFDQADNTSEQVDFHACRLELDINTAAENTTEITNTFIPKVAKELLQLANRYVTKGYQ